jgi:hypothetical protein
VVVLPLVTDDAPGVVELVELVVVVPVPVVDWPRLPVVAVTPTYAMTPASTPPRAMLSGRVKGFGSRLLLMPPPWPCALEEGRTSDMDGL